MLSRGFKNNAQDARDVRYVGEDDEGVGYANAKDIRLKS